MLIHDLTMLMCYHADPVLLCSECDKKQKEYDEYKKEYDDAK